MTLESRRQLIPEWWEAGKAKGATHLIVVRDSFSYEYYPVYVMPDQNVFLVADEHRTNPNEMRKLMEVFSYAHPLVTQLAQERTMDFELTPVRDPTPLPVDFEELKTLAKYAGILQRLLEVPASLVNHPHWRPAVLSCIAELAKLQDDLSWYYVEGVRYCARCHTRRCTRQSGSLECVPPKL